MHRGLLGSTPVLFRGWPIDGARRAGVRLADDLLAPARAEFQIWTPGRSERPRHGPAMRTRSAGGVPDGQISRKINEGQNAGRPPPDCDGRRPDGWIVARPIFGGGEAAFEGTVRRHGLMLLGVCRRTTGEFQAADSTFVRVSNTAQGRLPIHAYDLKNQDARGLGTRENETNPGRPSRAGGDGPGGTIVAGG
jgi:hypothetical protein